MDGYCSLTVSPFRFHRSLMYDYYLDYLTCDSKSNPKAKSCPRKILKLNPLPKQKTPGRAKEPPPLQLQPTPPERGYGNGGARQMHKDDVDA